MSELVAALPPSTVDEAGLAGEWELVYSDVELFRSSPFFLAIEVLTHRPAQRHGAAPAAHGCHHTPSTPALCPDPCRPPQAALDSSPGIPQLGKWLGLTDPTKKSALFFKLHQLQVKLQAVHRAALCASSDSTDSRRSRESQASDVAPTNEEGTSSSWLPRSPPWAPCDIATPYGQNRVIRGVTMRTWTSTTPP